MHGIQPYPSERMQSSNPQLGTPSGGHPDVMNAVGASRNPLVDIDFDPAETDQQPAMPSGDTFIIPVIKSLVPEHSKLVHKGPYNRVNELRQ
jgi:hypothetical protein